MRRLLFVTAALALHSPPASAQEMELVPVSVGLNAALFVTTPPTDASRLLIVEQSGRIRLQQSTGLTTFLDITGLVQSGGERGLLGMAFDPNYASNGHFYVNYTDTNGDTVVARYTVSADPDVADSGSALTILQVNQTYSNHNGGMMAFDPSGMLVIGMGDGGGSDTAQDPQRLLGKMLRIDVTNSAPGYPYEIPLDNPFVGVGGVLDEIWDVGVRNPWRWSFDRANGNLWIGDVGEGRFEEVSIEASGTGGGLNFGWDTVEGNSCFNPYYGCITTGLTPPIHTYNHGQGCSITGGYVYRGATLPWLDGQYLFSDWCGGQVWGLTYDGSVSIADYTSQLSPGSFTIVSYGEDADANIYIAAGYSVYRIDASLRLQASGLQGGAETTFDIEGAPPGETVWVAYSIQGIGSTDLPPLNVTLNLQGPNAVGSATADGAGRATFRVDLPAAASGRDVWFQALVDGNASNVFPATIQ